MSATGTIVFIFLLDHMPGDILNETLETVQVTPVQYSHEHTCDHHITDPILQITSRELRVLMEPTWLTLENSRNKTNELNEIDLIENSDEWAFETNKMLDNNGELENSLPLEEEFDIDKQLEGYENDINKPGKQEKEFFHVQVVKPPLLAAIFESQSNVTAQTCGGVVLNPHWLLTVASCVNILGKLREESSNLTEKSVYTVIVNASDPLKDGSAHNVTRIFVHSSGNVSDASVQNGGNVTDASVQNGGNVSDVSLQNGDSKPRVALMRIEPAVTVEDEVIVDFVEEGMEVTVYGWVMKKEAENVTMSQGSFEATVLSPKECLSRYNVTVDGSKLCLDTGDHNDDLSQLSWGGPVVLHPGGILAIAHGDGRAPLIAYPLDVHANWIHSTILAN